MATAFEDVEREWEKMTRKEAVLAFTDSLKAVEQMARGSPERVALETQIGAKVRSDPFFARIQRFKTYYDLKKNEASLSDAQRSELQGIEAFAPGIATAWANGKLKAMLYPWELYVELKDRGIGSREDATMIAMIEARHPEMRQKYATLKGKGRRRRTGRGRRARGRGKNTRRR